MPGKESIFRNDDAVYGDRTGVLGPVADAGGSMLFEQLQRAQDWQNFG